MKKCMILLLVLMMVLMCSAACAQERAIAPYRYDLTPDGAYEENLIFPGDVIIGGDQSQIVFSNCEFQGDIIFTSVEATRVMLLGCEVKGTFIFRNPVQEATIEYSMPKLLMDNPVTVINEDCIGTVVTLSDAAISINGEEYTMQDAQYFSDADHPEAGIVPYEGQDASYLIAAQWYENGEKVLMLICENEPAM